MKKTWLVVVFYLGFACQPALAEQARFSLVIDDLQRWYQLYLPPSYDKNRDMPLLIVLHGRSGNAQRMADLTRFNARAEQHGFAVIYPEAANGQWNYLHGISGHRPLPNDSEFVLRVTDIVKGIYAIDVDRIYIAGISNGGFMAQRLACYAPDSFAGFASVAAGGYAAMPLECKQGRAVDILYMHGTADQKVPWQGLGIKDRDGNRQLVTMSLSDSLKFWSRRNRCGREVASKELLPRGNSPGTHVKVLSSSGCRDDARVVLYAIIGGGHNWPGVSGFIPPAIAGRVNMDIHASDVIWSFFDGRQ